MQPDPLAIATDSISDLITRKARPLSSLEATFNVVEAMDAATAKQVLGRLLAQRYLCQLKADLAQMLAQKLAVPVQWSHTKFNGGGEWVEGRGS